MTTKTTKTTRTTKARDRVARDVVRHTKPEQHLWQAWGSDDRFERCACGAARRADYVNPDGQMNPNPCVQRWGLGPAGATCKTCAHLKLHQEGGRWYKCSARDDLTHGAKTDQRVRWDACARYKLKLLREEAPPDVSRAELESRGVALTGYMSAFHQVRSDLDARKHALEGVE